MRGFSDQERERIREQLTETGQELLLTYGPKKTSITDITEPVGIAKSTFYRFFDSKADLYIEILEQEMQEYVEDVRSELDGIEDPCEGLERFFWYYADFAEDNPLIQQMVVKDNYRDIFRNVSQSKLEAVQHEGIAEFRPLIEDLKERSDGPLAEMDLLTLFGLMGGSIGFMVVHKDEFEEYEDEFEYGDRYYEHVQGSLISTLARGLTVECTD